MRVPHRRAVSRCTTSADKGFELVIPRSAITGLVLAGGRGTRMGGVDKGLQMFAGLALAARAMQRLAPQVGSIAINANRHHDTYAAFGAPVWADAFPDHPGPLAGFLTGLEHVGTEWLVTVPCDAPLFPLDLVARLAFATESHAVPLAIASTPHGDGHRAQPVFCLMHRTLAPLLREHLQARRSGQVEAWVRSHKGIEVNFADAAAFANANTLAELERLERVA